MCFCNRILRRGGWGKSFPCTPGATARGLFSSVTTAPTQRMENSIHDIDLMLWYTGERVRRVRGYERRATGRKHPDTFWGILEFEGGALGVVETIWLLPANAGIALDDALQVWVIVALETLAFSQAP